MATIRKRGEYQWEAQIRKKGFPTQSKTFNTKPEVEAWAVVVVSEMVRGVFVSRAEAGKNSLGEILLRYQREITPQKKSVAIESVKIDVLLRDKISQISMAAPTGTLIAEWRDRRLKEVSGATVNREIDVLSTVINLARREWGIHIENPVAMIRRPDKGRARERRLSGEEEQYL